MINCLIVCVEGQNTGVDGCCCYYNVFNYNEFDHVRKEMHTLQSYGAVTASSQNMQLEDFDTMLYAVIALYLC